MAMHKRRGRKGRVVFIIILLIISALLIDSNYRLVTTEYTIPVSGLPAGFNRYRIVQLSDIHASEFGEENKTLISAVKEQEPDIITITGDLIDDVGQLDTVGPLLRALAAIAPVYYISGNHEWASGDVTNLFSLLEECGVKALRNEFEILTHNGAQVVLAGVDDPNGPFDMKKPKELAEEIATAAGEDAFVILLAHRNDALERYEDIAADIILCGHAHGGMIRIPFTEGLIGPGLEWFPEYTGGVYDEEDTLLVVSRGIGNHTGYPRFLNNPQVVSVTLTIK